MVDTTGQVVGEPSSVGKNSSPFGGMDFWDTTDTRFQEWEGKYYEVGKETTHVCLEVSWSSAKFFLLKNRSKRGSVGESKDTESQIDTVGWSLTENSDRSMVCCFNASGDFCRTVEASRDPNPHLAFIIPTAKRFKQTMFQPR